MVDTPRFVLNLRPAVGPQVGPGWASGGPRPLRSHALCAALSVPLFVSRYCQSLGIMKRSILYSVLKLFFVLTVVLSQVEFIKWFHAMSTNYIIRQFRTDHT